MNCIRLRSRARLPDLIDAVASWRQRPGADAATAWRRTPSVIELRQRRGAMVSRLARGAGATLVGALALVARAWA